MMLRHTARILLRRPLLFTSRNIFTTTRSIRDASSKSSVLRARAKDLFATDNDTEKNTESNTVPQEWESIIIPDKHDKILAHARRCWPPPPFLPSNWSATWSDWEALLLYYSSSPYYLMIPRIQMHVNIQYGIRGETRPILFSNKRGAFMFTTVYSNNYFLFDGCYGALYHIKGVCNDSQLVELVAEGDDAIVARLQAVEQSEEGLSALQRIMARDKTVIPLLAEKFLSYTPVETTLEMERKVQATPPEEDAPPPEDNAPPPEEGAHHEDIMSRWQREVEKELDYDADDSYDKVSGEVDAELGRLTRALSTFFDLKEIKENEVRRLVEEKETETEKEKVAEEVAEEEVAEEVETEEVEEVDEEGVMMLREEVAKFATVVNVADPKDIPPELLERVKSETKFMQGRADELIREMENFSVEPHQEEVFQQMKETAKSLRARSEELSVTDNHMMAIYLARSLEQNFGVIKNNPKALDKLIRDDN